MWWWRAKPPRTPWQQAEDLAARHLQRHGYKILARNLISGRNELDIVALKGDTTVFVEVRSRTANDDFRPEDSIGPEKQRRLLAAARAYMRRHPNDQMYYRFDVIAITPGPNNKPALVHYEDAFQP
jgi:putative endonuclease